MLIHKTAEGKYLAVDKVTGEILDEVDTNEEAWDLIFKYLGNEEETIDAIKPYL